MQALRALALAAALLAPSGAQAGSPVPDVLLTTQVKLALLTHDGVPGTEIEVKTEDGRVTLSGRVESPIVKARAERIAARVDGVRSVRNFIAVEPAALREGRLGG